MTDDTLPSAPRWLISQKVAGLAELNERMSEGRMGAEMGRPLDLQTLPLRGKGRLSRPKGPLPRVGCLGVARASHLTCPAF